jgi:putative addiction module antidote
MIQKIIQVGSSAAVTIPKKFLKEAGFQTGDEVRVDTNLKTKSITISPKEEALETSITPQFAQMVSDFIKTYRPALEKLAKK